MQDPDIGQKLAARLSKMLRQRGVAGNLPVGGEASEVIRRCLQPGNQFIES